MQVFKNLLVAVDLSKNCIPALKLAIKLARPPETEEGETEDERKKGKLTLLYVLPSSGKEVSSFRSMYRSDISGDKLLSNYIYPRLEEWVEKVENGLTDRAQLEARVGEPAEEILKYQEENNNDIILLGTHGRSGFRRLWIGSVAEEVVRRAQCPVLTSRRGEATAKIIEE